MPPLPSGWNPVQRARLESLRPTLEEHPRLQSAILFGELVRRGDHGLETPVGLALQLESMGDPADTTLAAALRMVFLSARVEPWLVVRSEREQLAELFPIRIFEVDRYGRHWFGPLERLEVAPAPEQLGLRIEQVARNMLKRRRWLPLMHNDPPPLGDLAEVASRLRVLLAAYDHLRGGTEDGFEARSATALGLPRPRLHEALHEVEPAAIDEVLTALVQGLDSLAPTSP